MFGFGSSLVHQIYGFCSQDVHCVWFLYTSFKIVQLFKQLSILSNSVKNSQNFPKTANAFFWGKISEIGKVFGINRYTTTVHFKHESLQSSLANSLSLVVYQ